MTLSCHQPVIASELESLFNTVRVRRTHDHRQRLHRLLNNNRIHRLRLLSNRNGVASTFLNNSPPPPTYIRSESRNGYIQKNVHSF